MDKQQLKPCPLCGGPPRQSKGGEGAKAWFGTGCAGPLTCAASLSALAHRTQEAADTAWNQRVSQPPSASDEHDARYRFLLALLIERGVLTDQRYRNGTWSLQGIYGVDDSGLRGAGRSPEEAIDNAIVMARLQPNAAEWQEAWKTAHQRAATVDTSPGVDAAEQKPVAQVVAVFPAGTDGPEVKWLGVAPSPGTLLWDAPPPAANAHERERERLRHQQSDAVMPLIGPLLDAWDFAQNDVRASIMADGIGRHLNAISNAMTADHQLDHIRTHPAQGGGSA